MRALFLGLRLTVAGGRSGVLRLAIMALGSAVAAFVILTSMALSGVADRQHAREQRIAPRLAVTATGVPTPSSLRFVSFGDGWDGRELRRVPLAATGPDAPVPLGLARLPAPGEVMLSPALADLADHEPLVAARFPQTRGPTIGNDGLVAPDQLLAYIGVRPDQLGPTGIDIAGFGHPSASGRLDPRAARTIGLLIVLTLVVPVVMFMTACARLSATSRSQRLAALRLLGLSARRTQLINAAETGSVALAGSIVGAGGWLLWRHTTTSVHVGAFSWFQSDLRLPAATIALTLAVLCSLSILTAVAGSQPAVARPLRVRRDRSTRNVSAWRLFPLVGGVAVLAGSRTTAMNRTIDFVEWMVPFGAGLGLTAVGLVLVTPFLAVVAGRALRHSDRPALLLASGRLRHEPAGANRATVALVVALFAAGVAQVVATALDRHDDDIRSTIPPIVTMEVVGPDTSAGTYRELSSLGVVLPRQELGGPAATGPAPAQDGGDTLDVLVATCDQLRTVAQTRLPTCRDDQIHRMTTPPDSPPRRSDAQVDATLARNGLPPIADHLDLTLAFVDGYFSDLVVLPPTLAPGSATRFFVPIPAAEYDPQVLTARLASASPTAFWNPLFTYVDRLDTPRLYRSTIATGTLAALVIGLAALFVATIDRALENRRAVAHLLALGTPPRTIRAALAVQILPLSLILFIAASVASVLGGSSYLAWGHPDEPLPLGPLVTLLVLSLIAASTATIAAIATITRIPQRELLRQE